jgi:two-component system, cell cycle sensor histidine kinase and response regulator CckA
MMISLVWDVTDRKRSEQEIEKLREQAVRGQKLEAIGRLAGGVAHDFNNILTGISGYAELLADELDADSQALGDVEEIRRLAYRAAELTQQLLAFSRRQTIKPVVLNINRTVETATKMLRRLIGEDIDLEIHLHTDVGNIVADPGQIEQVLTNLTINARDAMPTGGKLTIEVSNVDLDAEYADQHVSVTPGPHVMLAVTDTGCGMDAETRKHVFEPFFTTKKTAGGTGLGLATIYGIVRQHGGNIWVYSEPGKGTTFRAYFPRVELPTEADSQEDVEPVRATGTETILVVEDEPAVRDLAGRILGDCGYTVHQAGNADEAEAVMREVDHVALLLTDVVMPGRSGRELYEALAPDYPSLKVLYMSGYTENAIVHHGVLEKGIRLLQKPFTPQALARRVREVLDSDK